MARRRAEPPRRATTRSRTRASTTCRAEPPPILVSGFGPKAIRARGPDRRRLLHDLAGRGCDRPLPLRGRQGPGARGDQGLLLDDEDDARSRPSSALWPNEGLPGELAQVLPTPAHFEQACELVTGEHIASPVGPDLDKHAESLQAVRRRGRRRAVRAADRSRAGRVLHDLGRQGPPTLHLTQPTTWRGSNTRRSWV